MAISLYDLSVPTFLQTLGGVEGFLGRGLAHCQDNNIDPNEIVETPACARARATVRPDPRTTGNRVAEITVGAQPALPTRRLRQWTERAPVSTRESKPYRRLRQC